MFAHHRRSDGGQTKGKDGIDMQDEDSGNMAEPGAYMAALAEHNIELQRRQLEADSDAHPISSKPVSAVRAGCPTNLAAGAYPSLTLLIT